MPGVPAKPEAANFYPAGAAKDEVEAWMKSLGEADQAAARGFFTTIRRRPDGTFTSVPYSLEYQGELARAADLLRQAAALTAQPTLKAFLTRRAQAFLTNDYYDSDVAWMELDASIEPTLGPYEVYEDEWFNAKAAFEAYITLRDDAQKHGTHHGGHQIRGLQFCRSGLHRNCSPRHIALRCCLSNPAIWLALLRQKRGTLPASW